MRRSCPPVLFSPPTVCSAGERASRRSIVLRGADICRYPVASDPEGREPGGGGCGHSRSCLSTAVAQSGANVGGRRGVGRGGDGLLDPAAETGQAGLCFLAGKHAQGATPQGDGRRGCFARRCRSSTERMSWWCPPSSPCRWCLLPLSSWPTLGNLFGKGGRWHWFLCGRQRFGGGRRPLRGPSGRPERPARACYLFLRPEPCAGHLLNENLLARPGLLDEAGASPLRPADACLGGPADG